MTQTHRGDGSMFSFVAVDVEGEPSAERRDIVAESAVGSGGRLVVPLESGATGGFVVAFARASDGAMYALDVRRQLGVSARVALHTGEAVLGADGTAEGPALGRLARLRSMARPGQILLSSASREVLLDARCEGMVLRRLGQSTSSAERVWQLAGDDGTGGFWPDARDTGSDATNLPIQLTSFVGRAAAIEEVRTLLRHHRLVTLTGAGGCGKTRLALRVGETVVDEHPDGVRWVDLAPLADASLVPAALASVLGVPEPPEPITETVVRHLANRRALVLLDNCEHLTAACASLVARLVQGCPAVTVLATSREPLGVAGEMRFAVPPLAIPQADAMADSESVRLFLDRARAARPGFALTADNASAVAEICRRLDGIPLAIELAAARCRLLTVEQISEGLDDRFHLLAGGARTALPRQRTLEGSVGWSHDLLDDRERAVFRRLAAFAGSFTLDAAEMVCAGSGVSEADVLDLLGALVDRSLVQVADEAALRTRYRLLETIKDYARHRMVEAGEAAEVRDRHLAWCAAFADRAAAGLEGPDHEAWLARVDAELDNVRAALDWSTRAAHPEAGARIVGRLALYWFARSEVAVGRARLAATLDGASGGPDRAAALSVMCHVAYRAGDMSDAAGYGDAAIEVARRTDDARTLARALHARAWVRFWGEADRAGAWAEFEEAGALLRQTDDQLFLGLNLALLGWSYVDTSRAPRARALLAEAVTLTSRSSSALACAIFPLGWLDQLEGRTDDAVARFQQAVQAAQEGGDHYIEIFPRSLLAMQAVREGRLDQARQQCERGLQLAVEHRLRAGEASMRAARAMLHLAEGVPDRAEAEMEVASRCTPMPWMAAVIRGWQAQLALARPDVDARRFAEEALSLGREYGSVVATGHALDALATLARREGNHHRAEDLLHEAVALVRAAGFAPLACDLLDALAGVVADQGRLDEAVRLASAAHASRPSGPGAEPLHGARGPQTAQWRDALGADAFDAAWAEGAVMSLDEAVEYARRGRGARRRPNHGWESLTPTECRVVQLVAEGLTNPQIGERLFVSRRTVQTHLAHVFAKLQVSTRAELAALSTQRALERR